MLNLCRTIVVPSWMPHIGMKFNSTKEAWNFWTCYGGHIGFDVRVNYENKSKLDGAITSRDTFVPMRATEE